MPDSTPSINPQSDVKDNYQAVDVVVNYDQERFSSGYGRWLNKKERILIQTILSWIREHGEITQVLDVPCGTGRITRVLLEQNLEVSAGDVSQAMLDYCQKQLASQTGWKGTHLIDLDDIPATLGLFDLVTSIRLFHHIPADIRLRYMQSLSKLSKRYVLINYNYINGWHRIRKQIKSLLGIGISRQAITLEAIHAEARAAGLKVVKYWFVSPMISADLFVLFEKDS